MLLAAAVALDRSCSPGGSRSGSACRLPRALARLRARLDRLHLGVGLEASTRRSSTAAGGTSSSMAGTPRPSIRRAPSSSLRSRPGSARRNPHHERAFVMVPFQLVTVAAVWAFRTRTTPWLAALVALWPLNAFFWEFRFDLVPTALLALGLCSRAASGGGSREPPSGSAAASSGSRRSAFVFLAVWLLARGAGASWGRTCAAFVAVFVGLHLPFLLWSSQRGNVRVPLLRRPGADGRVGLVPAPRPLGLATVNEREFWLPADVPGGRIRSSSSCRRSCCSSRSRRRPWRVRGRLHVGRRDRRDGPGGLPPHEPRLQPAVPRPDPCRLGDRGRRRSRVAAESSSRSASRRWRQPRRTRSSTLHAASARPLEAGSVWGRGMSSGRGLLPLGGPGPPIRVMADESAPIEVTVVIEVASRRRTSATSGASPTSG